MASTDLRDDLNISVHESLLMVSIGSVLIIDCPDNLESALMESALKCHQALKSKLNLLKKETIDGDQLWKLPESNYLLPRVRKIQKPAPPTRWENFAKKKGIQKKKKSAFKLDKEKDEYVPRFGSKRTENVDPNWVIEDKKGLPLGTDPFEIEERSKKERVAKNELNRVKNISKNLKNNKQSALTTNKNKISKQKSQINIPKGNFKDEKNFALDVLNSLNIK